MPLTCKCGHPETAHIGDDRCACERFDPRAELADVIQLDPEWSPWGPLLCVVSHVEGWGVHAYHFVPTQRGVAPIRVGHEHYARIGRAAWVANPVTEDEPSALLQ